MDYINIILYGYGLVEITERLRGIGFQLKYMVKIMSRDQNVRNNFIHAQTNQVISPTHKRFLKVS